MSKSIQRISATAPYLVLLLVAGIIAANLAPSMGCACPTYTDFSLINLEIERAKQGEVLLGSYSRLGFRHPGPIIIYYYALADSIAGSFGFTGCTAALSQFILNFACLAIAVVILRNRIGPACALLVIGAIVERLSQASPLFWSSYWNPAAVPLPALLVLISVALIKIGEWRYLTLFTIASSVMVQSHLGSLPLIVVFSIILFGIGIVRFARGRWTGGDTVSLLVSFALALLLWAPPLWEAIQNRGSSNVIRIALAVLNPGGEGSHSGLSSVLMFYGVPSRVSPWIPLAVIAGIFAGAFYLLRSKPLERALLLTWAIAFAASILAAASAQGEWHSYLMWYHYTIAALFFALAGWAVLWRLSGIIPGNVAIAGTVALGAAVILITLNVRRTGALKCRNTPAEIPVELGEGSGQIVIDGDSKGWPKAALLYTQLYRKGLRPCTVGKWKNLFGRDITCPNVLAEPVRRVYAGRKRPGDSGGAEPVEPELDEQPGE